MAEYTLVALDGGSGRLAALVRRIRDAVRDTGLPPSAFDVVTSVPAGATFPLAVVAVAWFDAGPGASPAEVERLLDEDVPVVPVTAPGVDFVATVPPSLHHLNGVALDPSTLGPLASDVLRLLGLLPRSRRAFISYRRAESSAVAHQLAGALDQAGFDTFLDTKSIERGEPFQERLWDTLVDVGVVVFLHTPSALDSTWVAQELRQATRHGLGVVEVRWPTVRSAGLLAEEAVLRASDLTGTGASSTLAAAALAGIVDRVERIRAKAFAQRRRALIAELMERSRRAGLQPTIRPSGEVWLRESGHVVDRLVPVTGWVRTEHIYRAQARASGRRLLYDDRPYSAERRRQLRWLLDRLGLPSLRVAEVKQWLRM